ncbi:MAG: hypothetical protein RR595_08540 [Lysinibacillus sp.]
MASNKDIIQEKINVTAADVAKAIGAPTFTKSQIVKSDKYATCRDALNALLDDSKEYSFTEVNEILKKFDEGGKK